MVTLLIDGDPIAHAASHASKDIDEEGFARDTETVEASIDAAINNIFYTLDEKYDITVNQYKIFISGAGNFRKIINKDYKANRKKTIRPPLLGDALNYLKESWDSFVCDGKEADDGVVATWWSMLSSDFYDLENDLTIICSLDKDFKTVPCMFFDYYHSRNEIVIVSPLEANRFFFTQMITGDHGDSIIGIPRKGIKGAEKALDGISTEFGMRRKVFDMYREKYGNKARREYTKNHMMLYMLRDGIDIPNEFNTI